MEGVQRSNLAHIDGHGSLDQAWRPPQLLPELTSPFLSVALQGNKVLVAGPFRGLLVESRRMVRSRWTDGESHQAGRRGTRRRQVDLVCPRRDRPVAISAYLGRSPARINRATVNRDRRWWRR